MTLLFQMNTISYMKKMSLALSNFIKAVNGGQDFEAQNHHKKYWNELMHVLM